MSNDKKLKLKYRFHLLFAPGKAKKLHFDRTTMFRVRKITGKR